MVKLLRLARPQFLVSSLPIYTLGALWAILQGTHPLLFQLLLGYLIILLAQLSISFSNDYFDVEVDKLGTPTLFSGGSRILVENPEWRKSALWIALALNICSVIVGVVFQQVYSYPIWFLGVIAAINIVGWLYSAPPFKLAYRGFGELLTALSLGFLVPVIGYLIARGNSRADGLLLTIPLVLYGMATILLVEIPDMEADCIGQKKTWVAQKGRRFGFSLVGTLIIVATGSLLLVPLINLLPLHFNYRLLEFFALLPLGAGILGMIKRPTERIKAINLMNTIIAAMAVFFIVIDIVLFIAVT